MDFNLEVLHALRPLEDPGEVTTLLSFDFREPYLIPGPDALVARALEWGRGDLEEVGERIQFYSADEVPLTPVAMAGANTPPGERTKPARATTPRKVTAPRGGGGKGGSPASPPSQRRGQQLQQVRELSDRTAAMEATTAQAADWSSALRKPIGGLTMSGSGGASSLKGLVVAMPPPKSSAALKSKVTFTQQDTDEMLAEIPDSSGSNDMARAMLAQSQALTALVSQIANGSSDPFHDLGSSSASLSSKGSLGRARLQAELAAHKGTFFSSVLQSMSRRMYPAQRAEVEMSVLRDRGVTATQYLERFGGFGRTKDIGFIIWQVALCLNHLQEENFLAAKDAISLLFVCLEQTAMDNGKMEVGLLLALVEDPPYSLFSGRSVAVSANPRPFAPTANQRWVTTALQYLTEMDVISSRRAEVTSSRQSTTDNPPNVPGPKKKGKGCAGGGVKANDLRDEDRLHEEITFQGFLSCCIRWILRSRTVFATFLARSFHAQRSGASPATAVFPLPIPFEGLFGKQRSPKLSRSQLRKLCIKRAVHVVVIALNYIHNGMRPISVSLLGRRPTLAQLSVFRRLRALITACDLPGGQYPLPPGRSGFEFIARIVELEKFSAAHPAFNFDYGTSDHDEPKLEEKVGTIEEEHQFIINEKFSPLQPYRALDASRLKLSGKGQWDMQKYISSVLWLPFQDPGILCHGYPLGTDGPSFARESREENLKLAKLWDSRGLLAMFHEEHHLGLSCRVFNAHKNAEVDRQIGDRRWFNAAECHPRGPSAYLPSGHLITSLHCPSGYKLVGCAADRKDFYHQAKVTRRRAHTNILPFTYPLSPTRVRKYVTYRPGPICLRKGLLRSLDRHIETAMAWHLQSPSRRARPKR